MDLQNNKGKGKKNARVKNPCKVCSLTVSKKTGIRCKGVCRKWAHFTCLNYSPDKINDIKSGTITIICPCPICDVEQIGEAPSNHEICTNNNHFPSELDPDLINNEKKSPIPSYTLPQAIEKNKSKCENTDHTNSDPYYEQNTKSIGRRIIHVKASHVFKEESCQVDKEIGKAFKVVRTSSYVKFMDNDMLMNKLYDKESKTFDLRQTSSADNVLNKKIQSCFSMKCLSCSSITAGKSELLMTTIQQLCSTVGQLTKQVRELMSVVMHAQ